ncbi:hypothetical protein [Methylotuvimicrobium sp. KM2]
MAVIRKQSFIAVTNDQDHIRWLNTVFKDEGEVVVHKRQLKNLSI